MLAVEVSKNAQQPQTLEHDENKECHRKKVPRAVE
jgi:hypothetical protein